MWVKRKQLEEKFVIVTYVRLLRLLVEKQQQTGVVA